MKSNALLEPRPALNTSFWIGVVAVCAGLLLGVLGIWVSPLVVFGALAALAFLAIGLKRPELFVLAYLVITASVLRQTKAESVSLGFGTLYLTDVLLLLPLGLIIVRWFAEPHFRLVGTPLDLPLFVFLITSILSTVLAIARGTMIIQETLGEIRFVVSYLLFFVVTNLVREKKQMTFLLEGFLLLATVVAIITIFQSVLGKSAILLAGRIETFPSQEQIYRVIPPGQSILVVAFLTLVSILVFEKRDALNFNLWRYAQGALIGVAVLITFFRASWVSLAFCLLVLGILAGRQARRRFFLWLVTGILIVVLSLIALAGQPGSRGATFLSQVGERFGSLADPATYTDPSSSLRWRDFEYSYAVPTILANPANPFLGLGYGIRYRPWLPPRDWSGFDGRGFIHNGFLWIMMKSGILGFLAMASFLIAMLVRGLKNWRRVPDARLRAVVLAFGLVAVIVLTVSNVEPYVVQGGWPSTIAVIAGLNEAVIAKFAAQGTAEAQA